MLRKKTRFGGIKVDPAVQAFQERAATNNAALTRKQRREQKRVRVNFDVPPEVKAALEKVADAEHEDTSMAQVAAVLLAWGLAAYIAGQAETRALFDNHTLARTPRFAWNIEISKRLIETLAAFSSYGEV
ncbi:MAG: hypothetical protein J7M17_00990 [Anaerolineae bacterium]|nr:hypothetical protein [Anaerolineae bacterium]